MKIGIDARVLYAPVLKGIGVYLQNLVEEWAKAPSGHQFVLYYDPRQEIIRRKPKADCFTEKAISISTGDRFYFWDHFCLPPQLKRDRIEVLFSPANTAVFGAPCPQVVTVHDTILQEIPRPNRIDAVYYNVIQPALLKKAAMVLTPSAFSKGNIERILKFPGSRIQVIPQGIDATFRCLENRNAVEEVKKKYGISGNYIFNAGGESVWKNVSNLIKAYALLVKQGTKQKLVITGIRNPAIVEKHQKETADLGLTGAVKILGYVSREELVALYNGAEIFVYPSLLEGFGFPPAEAMACGAPVAASDACSIPEVVGDAGLLFDGRFPEQIAEKMSMLLGSEPLRQEYRRRGLERVRQFAWPLTAKRTLDILEGAR